MYNPRNALGFDWTPDDGPPGVRTSELQAIDDVAPIITFLNMNPLVGTFEWLDMVDKAAEMEATGEFYHSELHAEMVTETSLRKGWTRRNWDKISELGYKHDKAPKFDKNKTRDDLLQRWARQDGTSEGSSTPGDSSGEEDDAD